MDKLRIGLFGAALMLGSSLPCFADQVQGLVQSVNASNNTVVITDPVNGAGRTVHVHPKVVSDIKSGDVVKATLKSGSDEADTFEVVVAR